MIKFALYISICSLIFSFTGTAYCLEDTLQKTDDTYTITIPQGPSKPHATIPVTEAIISPKEIPSSGNTLGEVVATGLSEGKYWIDIKDANFEDIIKIVLDPKNIVVVNGPEQVEPKSINKGDTISVIYSKEDGKLKAHFISIVTGANLKAIQGSRPQE